MTGQTYITVVGAQGALTRAALVDIGLEGIGLSDAQVQWLAPETALVAHLPEARTDLAAACDAHKLDHSVTSFEPKLVQLFLADMDSTMITIECVDELADYAGIKAEVAEITEAAMCGDIDFIEALERRVALLKGLKEADLQACYDSRLQFSPGAKTAVATMAQHGATCALVSGGFTFFTERVMDALGFHLHRSNALEIKDGALTGRVTPPIAHAGTKLEKLQELQAKAGLAASQIMAVGDGANDIPMLKAAGLSVAYRAKPKTRAAANASIQHTDLTTLLYFQGIPRTAFAGD